jgi:hypothetical protein
MRSSRLAGRAQGCLTRRMARQFSHRVFGTTVTPAAFEDTEVLEK